MVWDVTYFQGNPLVGGILLLKFAITAQHSASDWLPGTRRTLWKSAWGA